MHHQHPSPRSSFQLLEPRIPRQSNLGRATTTTTTTILLRGKQVQLGGEHPGKEAGIPRARRADGEVQDHPHRHEDPGPVGQLVQAKQPDKQKHGPAQLDGDGPRVRVIPRKQKPRAEKIQKLRCLFAPADEFGKDVGLVLGPRGGDAENVPGAGKEEGAPGDGEEEPQGAADHGRVDGLDEVVAAALVEEGDWFFGDYVAGDDEEDHDGKVATGEEEADKGKRRWCFVELCDAEQWVVVA